MAIVGRRHSKRDILTQKEIKDLYDEIRRSRKKFAGLDKKLSDLCKESLNSNKSLPDLLSEAFPDAGDGSTSHVHASSFSEKLSCIKAKAINFLKAKGLPTSPIIYKVSRGKKWTESPKEYQKKYPKGKPPSPGIRLDYIDPRFFNAKTKADSPEDMAMRAICLIDEIENPRSQDERESAIFRLGQLIALSTVYGNESNQTKKSAQASRKKKWAVALAKYLVNKYPNRTFEECWRKLETNIPEDLDYSFELKDEELSCEGHGSSIQKISFSTGYFYPARNRKRSKSSNK